MALKQEDAERVAAGALAKARELGIGITVCVVDEWGHLMAMRRMEGVRFATIDIAMGKAFTSAAFQRKADIMPPLPFFAGSFEVAGRQVVPLIGGMPIREGERVVGGVGCAGGTGEQDLECSEAGVAAF
ncbi:MAG TPA: heme-binding protein [Dehalococcoidia bacterium]|nr:heme-binding protein [Dehalococcoidia bacterium]